MVTTIRLVFFGSDGQILPDSLN